MPVHGNINSWIFSQNNNPAIFGESYPAVLDDGNTAAWFDSDEAYMTNDGNNLVSQWADRSGNDNHLLQATGSKQPTWSASGVLFNGTSNALKTAAFTLEQSIYIYIVFKQITWTSNDRIFDGNVDGTGELYQGGASPLLRASAGTVVTSGSFPLNKYTVARVLFNGADSRFIADNGVQNVINLGAGDMNAFTLGSRYDTLAGFSNIEVKEVIIRKTADTSSDSDIIWSYLNSKHSVLEAETLAYTDSLSTALSVAEVEGVDTFIKSLKSGWEVNLLSSVGDAIYIRSGETEEQSLRNIVSRTNDSTKVGSPTFTTDQGFTSSAGNYIDVNYKASNGINFQKDDAGYCIYTRTRIENAVKMLGGAIQSAPVRYNQLLPLYSDDFNVAINGSGNSTNYAYNYDRGMYAGFRDGANSVRGYVNSNKKITSTVASSERPDINFFEGTRNFNGSENATSTYEIAFSYYGRSLTWDEYFVLLVAYETYMRSKSKGILSLAEISTTKDAITSSLVFESGVDFTDISGTLDAFFRIPFIHKTTGGSIITGAEARYGRISDYAMSDMVIKISDDDGATWSAGVKIVENNGVYTSNTAHGSRVVNPCIVQKADRIFLFHTKLDDETVDSYYGSDLTGGDWNADFGYIYSDDDGDTWSAFVDLSSLFSVSTNMYAAGPGNGIVMANGTIVIPFCDYRFSDNILDTGTDWGIRAGICYSTDEGANWQISSLIPQFTDETAVVEYDSKLYMLSRFTRKVNRMFWTDDMGATWNADATRDQKVNCIPTQMTLINYKDFYLFLAPFGGTVRSDMRIRKTEDLYNFVNIYQITEEGLPASGGYSGITTDGDDNLFAVNEVIHDIEFRDLSAIKDEI